MERKIDADSNVMCEIKNGKGILKRYDRDDSNILSSEGQIINGEFNGKFID